ncbi:helix-turn-helix domain-containing protein [Pseudoclavibacter helvolus]|uniref:Lambda repressor-like predicted transcriptional regulator n=1 Tax=Pseudoclavibacter helvolus TaxID=255205 RepID=A0A7W4UMB1_9MICO|nr:helix-turn-helix transcriptional regulator [Pseudoclavibacter helvolus]MBB2957008.1 lambda repressor-like predicted transcriptional regulator [Pseudoclavibacter helvolus]
MDKHIIEWTATAVSDAIKESGRTKLSVSDETGIPYPTLNRKLAAKSEFSFSELLKVAEALSVSPAAFTPPQFQVTASHAA